MTPEQEAVQTAHAMLFVPANRPERFAKAAESGAGAIVIDLEDAVAPPDKDPARAGLASLPAVPVVIRVNAPGTQWHDADMEAVRRLSPAAVMLPKSETAPQVQMACRALGPIPVIALIETARGLAHSRQIAAVDGVVRLAFGSVDYCADLRCAHEQAILLPARSEIVLASRLADLAPPLDGVTVEIRDDTRVAAEAGHSRALGMGGKLAIHPAQVAPILAAFHPSPSEIDWARRVLASGDGAVSIDGAMVDAPVRARARRILAASDHEMVPSKDGKII